jgi:hypothetical protein
VGRLYGAEERVLERVVTYLVSALKRGIILYEHAHPLYQEHAMHDGANTPSM